MSFPGKVRIIGGKWKGRKIIVADSKIRPTKNYVREVLFNWLDPVIYNLVCLDCFAGSGALGLESLSRGARAVTFLDNNLVYINVLLKTIQFFCIYDSCSEVIYTDFFSWLKRSDRKYDLIFIDPPFRSDLINKVILFLERYQCFSKQSWIYIETMKNSEYFLGDLLPKNWVLFRKKITGIVVYYLYMRYVKL